MSSATAGGQAGLLLVAARGRSGQIGRDNALLWRIPEDLKFFRSITMGRVLIMGRKTFDSIGGVALPGRQLVILSRSRGCDQAPVYWRDSPEAALELARRLSSHKPAVAGGAEIYRLLLPQADEMWLTEVDADPPADAHFPSFDEASWQDVERMRLAPNAIVRHLKRL